MVSFSCPVGFAEKVKLFLKHWVKGIHLPETKFVSNVNHGADGRYSRFDIKQTNYAGGRYGYIEVLQILDAPEGHADVVINDYFPGKSQFSEWETVKDADDAFKRMLGDTITEGILSKFKGFRRLVNCGHLTPWFYATGEEVIIGDYAFPNGLQDDPVFRVGRRFVVYNKDGTPLVKTCMGTKIEDMPEEFDLWHSSTVRDWRKYRLVYWHDGTVWDESGRRGDWFIGKEAPIPIPAGDEDLWVVEAMEKFRKLLTGETTGFQIPFLDGSQFIGRLKPNKATCPEGNYLCEIVFDDGESVKGWVKDFKPSKKCPDITQYVVRGYANHPETPRKVTSVTILQKKVKSGGKKWAGVFYSPPKENT